MKHSPQVFFDIEILARNLGMAFPKVMIFCKVGSFKNEKDRIERYINLRTRGKGLLST